MKKQIKNLRGWWLYLRDKSFIDHDQIIVRFDGGICSQIAFWALFHELSERGFSVKADLTWYKENGKDMNGVHDRGYDLPIIFPSCELKEATESEIFIYKKRHLFKGNSLEYVAAPAYLGEYFDRWPLVLKYREKIRTLFQPDSALFSAELISTIALIRSSNSNCAVHVRRGDLSIFNPIYGQPIGEEYFLKAILLVEQLYPSTKFWLFSDEPDWVAKKIIPHIPQGICFNLINENDSSKGYLDLYLMCQCDHFIASQGSMAIYAMAICGGAQSVVVEPKSRVRFDAGLFTKSFTL